MMGPYWNVPYFKRNKDKSDKKCEWLDKSKVLINRDEETFGGFIRNNRILP